MELCERNGLGRHGKIFWTSRLWPWSRFLATACCAAAVPLGDVSFTGITAASKVDFKH